MNPEQLGKCLRCDQGKRMKQSEVMAAAIEERPVELRLVDSVDDAEFAAATKAPANWLRVGTFAAASAVLGGLAAAWFYRKTLSRLREAGNHIPESRTTEGGSPEDF